MNTLSLRCFTLLAAAALAPAVLHAAPEKYQVTGPIVAMDANSLTVMKGGKEKFVLARDASTKMTGGAAPKVGDKVTVQYTITATDVEVKADKAAGVTKESTKPASSAPTAPAAAPKPAPAGR